MMYNRQAIGYMLLACKEIGLDKETARRLYGSMYWQFDIKTEEEAEEEGFRWLHTVNNEEE